MPRRQVVTLLTDFGLAGPYVAEMKGVVLSLAPRATVVDISHDIPPGDVRAGGFVLWQAMRYFPAGTVHCAVVDPGVGTDRRILAARFAGQTVVFPDNGIVTFLQRHLSLEEIVTVRDRRYFLAGPTSATFHGRDIMAPVAAHLAEGLALSRLGPPAGRMHLLELPRPRLEADGAVAGEVVFVDAFGNLVSDIPVEMIRQGGLEPDRVEVFCGGRSVGPLQAAYGFAAAGEPLALVNSMSLVEIAVNGGRACDVLGAGVDTPVRVVPRASRP